MTYEEWAEAYLPYPVDFNGEYSFIDCEFFDDVVVVDQKNRNKLWTVVEVDGKRYLMNGYHYVNRMAYVFCFNEWNEGEQIEVLVDE